MSSQPKTPLTPDSQKKQLPLWRIVGTLLSVALLVYLITTQGWEEFIQVLQQVPLTSFLLAFGLMLLSRLCVTLRWFVLLRFAGVRMRFLQCLRLTFMGLFASNFLPSTVGGDLVRMAGAVYQRVDPGVSAASLLVDRLVGMAGMALLLPFGLAAVMNGAAPLAQHRLYQLSLLGMLRLPGFAGLHQRASRFVASLMRSSMDWLRNPVSLAWALLCTCGHMLFTFLSVAVLLAGMNQPLSFWSVGGLWSLSYFVTLIPISINGFGLQEVSITYLYTHFGGVSMQAGLALAVLMRMLFLAASLPGAFFLPDILNPAPASKPQHP